MNIASALARDLDSARARALASDLADDLDSARARALDLTGDPGHELVRDLDRARALVQVRTRTLALADALDSAHTHAIALEFELGHGHHLAFALDRAQTRALRLASVYVLAAEQHGAEGVAPSAASLLAAAASLLPPANRARYAEEYLSELWELAQCGAGRLRQLQYALHQLRGALPTSFALRSPRRRSAAP